MASRKRTRRNAFTAAVSVAAITGALVLTGCGNNGDGDDDCDSMGTTQQRSSQQIALAATASDDNLVQLPTAATLPNFGSNSFASQADTKADGSTMVLADDCGGDDDDDDGDDD